MKKQFLSLFVALFATTALWASNVITYTATDWIFIEHTDAFNVAIASYEYDNGVGAIIFDGEVTTIGNYAFYWYSDLTSITIPSSVIMIGERAFSNCSGLTSITIPNSVTTIGNYAFESCIGLTSITIGNSVETIGDFAFNNCSGLTSLIIPNSVTTIGSSAFEGCKRLTSITIPNSVETIGEFAFYNCSGLTSVTIPNSVETIGEYAFYNCSGLTSLTIPDSVTTIGNSVFWGCSRLQSITIPNTVTTIGNKAFYGCSGLTSITCLAAIPPTCGSFCFTNTYIPLYVPAGSVGAYKAANEWKDFTDIRPIITVAQEVEVSMIESEPTESTIEIAWPTVDGAETYTIEIHLGDELVCSTVFNAQGQLVYNNLNLAPSRGHMHATTAEGTATGWAYTIVGLNPNTNYTYSVIAKNATDQVIDTKSGTFTTCNAPTNLYSLSYGGKDKIRSFKFIRHNQLHILREGKFYNALGGEVR